MLDHEDKRVSCFLVDLNWLVEYLFDVPVNFTIPSSYVIEYEVHNKSDSFSFIDAVSLACERRLVSYRSVGVAFPIGTDEFYITGSLVRFFYDLVPKYSNDNKVFVHNILHLRDRDDGPSLLFSIAGLKI